MIKSESFYILYNTMKNIIIGGIVTVIVVAGATVLLNWWSSSKIDALEALAKDYQQLSEDFKNNKTKSNLLASCKNSKKFNKQIQNLENKLDKLKQKKNTINNPTIETEKEYIPRPGEQVPDLSDPDYDNTLWQINVLEKEMLTELNNLKSLCDNQEKDKKEIISTSCVEACKKYSECTHYTEDTTEQDRRDAYDSCMIECADWSDKTKICINKKTIKTVSDCTNLSMCALAEYNKVMTN